MGMPSITISAISSISLQLSDIAKKAYASIQPYTYILSVTISLKGSSFMLSFLQIYPVSTSTAFSDDLIRYESFPCVLYRAFTIKSE